MREKKFVYVAVVFCLFVFFVHPAFLYSEPKISPLERDPDWSVLEKYQGTITRKDFEDRVNRIYSHDGAFFKYLEITDDSVSIYRDKTKQAFLWKLHFGTKNSALPSPRSLGGAPQALDNLTLEELIMTQALRGVKICLDPGHIGGKWAQTEERSFNIKGRGAVEEAYLNLQVCRRLAVLLERAGATVVWTKTTLEPVTQLRPQDLRGEAQKLVLKKTPKALRYLQNPRLQEEIQKTAIFLFYRSSEIHARADRINKSLKPDITLCVHHNAGDFWIPKIPNLVHENRLIIFANGSYMASELEYDDQKFYLMRKLLERSVEKEVVVGEAVAHQMVQTWGWPPCGYELTGIAHRASDNPYIWYRNLMASRLFAGPVVFIEGPFMNDAFIYRRLLAGDYEGTKLFDGKPYRSLYREFSEVIARGVISYYATEHCTPPVP